MSELPGEPQRLCTYEHSWISNSRMELPVPSSFRHARQLLQSDPAHWVLLGLYWLEHPAGRGLQLAKYFGNPLRFLVVQAST